jgi:hypothetical protein
MKSFSGIIWLFAVALSGCLNSPPTPADSSRFTPVAQGSAALPEPVSSTPVPAAPAYAMESLLANSAYWISNRVQGKDGADTNGIRATFSSMKWSLESNSPITCNTNCWLHGVKGLTAMSPFNRQAAYHAPGTAVSPRHILMVTHMRSQPGTVFEFATMDSQIVRRKLIAYSDSTRIRDLSIGLLDADLPPSIGFMRVMPGLWRQCMPEAFQTRQPGSLPANRSKADVHPVVAFNHWKQGFVADFAGYSVLLDKSVWFPEWFGYAAGGDSGHPICLLANNELFLITLYSFPSGGMLYPDYLTVINTELEELSRAHRAPVYRLTVADELMKFKTRQAGGDANTAR